jgi:beta-glucosidase
LGATRYPERAREYHIGGAEDELLDIPAGNCYRVKMLVRRQLFVIGCLALALGSCRSRPKMPSERVVVLEGDATEPPEPNDEPPPPKVERWLVPQPLVSRVDWVTPACVERVSLLVGQMTLQEKIGQMTQPDRRQLDGVVEEVKTSLLGSVLSGGGSAPQKNEPSAWLQMVEGFSAKSLETRLRIPLIYGIDAVHGNNNVYGATIFPHNIGLGASRNSDLVERVARATAEETRATGIDWAFAPVLAAARDERWGRTYEAFGETPELAAELGAAAIRGLQGARLGADGNGVLACAKHFVGDGGTHRGRDQGNTIVDAEQLRDLHLRQYEAAIAAGVGSIMVSFSSINGTKMHANRALLTEVLKNAMKFQGFLVTDWGALEKLEGDFKSQVEQGISAGVDMVMGSGNYHLFQRTLADLVPAKIPMSRLDDAVTRILTVKCEAGLFEPNRTRPSLSVIGSAAHREIAREAVQKSLVLLENRGQLLPLSRSLKHIHVAGKNADDIGRQCGGWTISWQGQSGPVTVGTTIRKAIENTVAAGTKVTYSADGKGSAGAEVVIVVVGEHPYAEGNGDSKSLQLDGEDLGAIDNAKSTGAKVVVVLISGRPLLLGEVQNKADSIVAAWLPGTEGQGVADVLFGTAAPSGKLSHSWPRDMAQIPINVGDREYEPLYPYGYGLGYR